MDKSDRPGLRLLVGATCFADAAAALRIVERLPGAFRADLGGVLIEEVDVLAACQIPHQRIVSASGATTLAPSLSQLRTFLDADARAFRESLARAADPSGAGWVFARDKGELVGTALRVATGWDVLVIGYRQVHRIPGKIVVLVDAASPQGGAMTEAADRLARHLSADRVVFSIGPGPDRAPLAQPPRTLRFDTLEDALAALTRMNTQAVLVDLTRGPVHNARDLARLLDRARCPLFVFGTARAGLVLEHSTQIPPSPNHDDRNDGL